MPTWPHERLVLVWLALAAIAFGCDDPASDRDDANAPDRVDDAAAPPEVGPSEDGGSDASTPEGARLLLNEVVADPVGDGVDWVELVAAGEGSVDLTAYTLVDDNREHIPHPLSGPPLAAGEFRVFEVVREPGPEASGFPFGLGGEDSLTLARDGETVDTLSWGPGDASEGASFGRLPDGVGPAQTLSPTPGAPNAPYEAPPELDPFPGDRVMPVRMQLRPSDWERILDAPLDEVYYPGDLLYDGVVVQEVAIRVKGNSSLQSVARSGGDRFSFKVDLNRYVDGQDLGGMTKLNFNNGYHDPSMMREHLAYELARSLGLPGSRTAYIVLFFY